MSSLGLCNGHSTLGDVAFFQKKNLGDAVPPTLIKKNFSQYGIPGPTKKSNTKGKKFKYLYPIGHDEIHYCISNFFAMCGVVMICSLYDVQLMVRYKLRKLIGVFYRYGRVS